VAIDVKIARVALTAAVFATAATLYIVAVSTKNRRLTWFSKPFAMPLLALCYLLACRGADGWILAGLGCACVGDLLLIQPERTGHFPAALAAFLLGHLLYLTAFLSPVVTAGTPLWLLAGVVPFAAAGIVVFRALSAHLGPMKLPVLVYTVVILAMGLAALLRYGVVRGLPFWLPLAGALCFLGSDTLLALQHFRGSIRGGSALVAVSYVCAQTLIVTGFVLTGGWRAG
jgi:uncharacterized membrane protein YhhN